MLTWYAYAFALYPQEFFNAFFRDQIGGKVTHSLFGPIFAFPGYLIVMAISFLFWPFILIFGFPVRLSSIPSSPYAVKMLAGWCVAVAAIFSIGGRVIERYSLPALPFLAVFLAMAFAALDDERMPRLCDLSRRALLWVSLVGFGTFLFVLAIEAELAPWSETAALFLSGTALWFGVVALGKRHLPVAPFLLGVTPLLTLALLTAPLTRLVMPDIGVPLAATLAPVEAPPGRVFFVGDRHDASGLRLSIGRADAFREDGPLSPELMDNACVVMTDSADVADALLRGGFTVDTVKGGWRNIDVGVFVRALLDGRLAEAREQNANRGYIAVPRPPADTKCNGPAAKS